MRCDFCEDIFKKNREQALPEKDTILFEDENIYIMPDISPLTVGHLLVISKRHYHGFASSDIQTIESLNNFFCYYNERIGNRKFTVFEHGAVLPFRAGASIDHAHMHILPFDIDIDKRCTQEFEAYRVYSLEELLALKERMQPYLFCMRSGEKEGWICEIEDVPSQILRKMTIELLGEENNYNWKQEYQNKSSHINFYKTLVWWKSLQFPNTFKWKKKLLLEKYGFVDYQGLVGEVDRFSKDDIDILQTLLEKELEVARATGNSYRIVLVPKQHAYYLPNYVISKKEHIYKLREFCERYSGFDEIWHMVNRSESSHNYSGRLSVYGHGSFLDVIIEMIPGDNLRKLDQYSVGKDEIWYLRARRKIGASNFEIEENTMLDYDNDILLIFERVKREVANYNKRIQYLWERLQQCGVRVLSMDFRVEDKKLIFIDWDTGNDETVLNHELV